MLFNYCQLCNRELYLEYPHFKILQCSCKNYTIKFHNNGIFHIEDFVLGCFAIETNIQNNILTSQIFKYSSYKDAVLNSDYEIIVRKKYRISPEHARKLLVII